MFQNTELLPGDRFDLGDADNTWIAFSIGKVTTLNDPKGYFVKYVVVGDNLSVDLLYPQLTSKIKISGVWKQGIVRLNVSGIWKKCVLWINKNGTWKRGV